MTEIYILALTLGITTVFSLVMKKLQQPLVVAYIVTGLFLSLFHIVRPDQLEFLAFLPEMGLAFLLFLVGMELDLKEFVGLGKSILVAAGGQILISSTILFLLLSQFGFPPGTSFLGALALSFSSTVLVIKLLSEHKELSSLHGKLGIGVLLLEDLVALLVLMFLAVMKPGGGLPALDIVLMFLKGGLLLWCALFAGNKLLPRLFNATAENTELLFLTAIGWCLVFVSFSSFLGFSLAIGAFLAGVSLAQSVYRVQISGKIKPLRDFFVMIFFIDLGTGVSLTAVGGQLPLVILMTFYTVLVRPVIFFAIFSTFRYRAKTAFQTAILFSAVSEFSLIVVFLAGKEKLISPEFSTPLIFATVLSFVCSSFLITHGRSLYWKMRHVLKKFERKHPVSFEFVPENLILSDHAILVGCHRSGQIVLKSLQRMYGENMMVVDFNPEVLSALKRACVPCVYGDIDDPEIQEKVNLKEAGLVVSTVRNLVDNLTLLDALEKCQSNATVILTASDTKEATTLYERGAHHVSVPVSLEGVSISRLIHDYFGNFKELRSHREKKLGDLRRQTQS